MKFIIFAAMLCLIVAIIVVALVSVKKSKKADKAWFSLTIDDVFSINSGDKVIVVGIVSSGEVRPGDLLQIRTTTSTLLVSVNALEAYHKPLLKAATGDRVAIMLIGAAKADIAAGDTLTSREP